MDRLWRGLIAPQSQPEGTTVVEGPSGWRASHPLPLAQLNTARPEAEDVQFVSAASAATRGRWSRISARRPLPGLEAALAGEGYRPMGGLELWVTPLQDVDATQHEYDVAIAQSGEEVRAWALASAQIRGVDPGELDPSLPWEALAGDRSPHRLLSVRQGDEVLGVGALQVLASEGLGLLWGAATAVPWRRRGVHRALLRARLQLARALGLELACSLAGPTGGAPALRAAGSQPTGSWIVAWERGPR